MGQNNNPNIDTTGRGNDQTRQGQGGQPKDDQHGGKSGGRLDRTEPSQSSKDMGKGSQNQSR